MWALGASTAATAAVCIPSPQSQVAQPVPRRKMGIRGGACEVAAKEARKLHRRERAVWLGLGPPTSPSCLFRVWRAWTASMEMENVGDEGGKGWGYQRPSTS